jgi:type I restriction enzyme S subunit
VSEAVGAFAVWFKELERWNVSFFKTGQWHWPEGVVKPLVEFTESEADSISMDAARERNVPIIAKITFAGELHLRPAEDYADYKGRLFLVRSKRIIFSKINARRGCILYVPDNHREFAVSGEYPILKLDERVAMGEYVNLALRVGPAKDFLFGAAAGMAKARTYLEDFQRVSIPLPSLDVQRAIVAQWQQAQTEVAELEARAEQLEAEIDAEFLRELGVASAQQVERPKVLVVNWRDVARWGVRASIDSALGIDQLAKSKFPHILLGTVAKVSYGIQKSPANRPNKHARPYLRVANVRKGYLDLSEIKNIDVPDDEMDTYRLEAGDILFVEGNGSRAELGRVAMWNAEIPDCVHQNHLIKVRVDRSRLLPEYAMIWFNTEVGRGHFFRSAKTSSGLGTINSNEVREAPIPLPPLAVQRELVQRAGEMRAEAVQLREVAAHKRDEAKTELEALILGTKSATVLQ